ncbi:MAG: GNAT family N-acetyltransferase [Bacteroidota bacterium]
MKVPVSVRLRPIRTEDASVTYKWRNHPTVREFFSGHGEEVQLADERAWVERQLQSASDSKSFGVEDAATGSLIGLTFLKNIDTRHRQAEFAILIDPDQAGRGFGNAACVSTLQVAFQQLQLHRVYLKVRVDNVAAIRLYDACGFMKEGTLHDDHFKNGRFVDQYIMAILAPSS